MNSAVNFLSQRLNLNLGKFSISPSYLQAGAILFLLFLLVLLLAQVRRHLLGWSLKGALFGIFWGFLLALIIEGFLVISGRTAFTEIIGWKNAPKPLINVLDLGRAKLVQVLGVETQVPFSLANGSSKTEKIIEEIQNLSPIESKKVKSMICSP